MKKIIKKYLYKYFKNIYFSLDYYLNLKKINGLKLHNFEIKNINFSMYSTENFSNPSWQKKETEVIINLLKNNDLFLNLGANMDITFVWRQNLRLK